MSAEFPPLNKWSCKTKMETSLQGCDCLHWQSVHTVSVGSLEFSDTSSGYLTFFSCCWNPGVFWFQGGEERAASGHQAGAGELSGGIKEAAARGEPLWPPSPPHTQTHKHSNTYTCPPPPHCTLFVSVTLPAFNQRQCLSSLAAVRAIFRSTAVLMGSGRQNQCVHTHTGCLYSWLCTCRCVLFFSFQSCLLIGTHLANL